MGKLKTCLLLLLSMATIIGCNNEDTSLSLSDEALVRVQVGSNVTFTRAALDESTPLTLYVYQRKSGAQIDLTASPYKVAHGVSQAGKSYVDFTVDGQPLSLKTDNTYDFLVIANSTQGMNLQKGSISSIGNGSDVMAGKLEGKFIANGEIYVDIKFTEDGNLPHLASNVTFKATASKGFIDAFASLKMKISGATFYRYPTKASLDFDVNPLKLHVYSKGTYELDCKNAEETEITSESDVATYTNGFMLPYLTKTNSETDYNEVDIDFNVEVNDGVNSGNVLLQAKAVHLPSFKPGYRYTFIIKMNKKESQDGSIDLYLSIDKWDNLSWESGMGSEDNAPYMTLKVGNWSPVSWTTGMGGENDGNKIIFSVSDWNPVDWSANIGGTNEDGTNN